jgi:uncharacterized protein
MSTSTDHGTRQEPSTNLTLITSFTTIVYRKQKFYLFNMSQSRVIAAGILRHCNRTASSAPRHRVLAQSSLSSWNQRGHDITGEALTFGDRPKVILQGFAPTGFDVDNLVKKVDPKEISESGSVHMNGSIMVFPFGCFLWNVKTVSEVTLESLAPVILHRPFLEYLFLGCNQPINRQELDRIQVAFRKQNIVVEQLDLATTVGTFNILNAEDRQVAAALVIDSDDDPSLYKP